MAKFNLPMVKDLGLQRKVMDALPYAVVGGHWKGTFTEVLDECTVLNHIVPAGQQLKLLFLRVWTQNTNGAVFTITQTNTGYTVVGSVPSGVRDYPMLEGAGAEVLHGSLRAPIHVFEGSVDFGLQHVESNPQYYGIVWWGVEKIPE